MVEYRFRVPDDLKAGDTISLVSKVNNGWRARLNNKAEIILTLSSGVGGDVHSNNGVAQRKNNYQDDDDYTTSSSSPSSLLEGWVLAEQHERWEKQWMIMMRNGKIGVFKNEQEKAEKMKKGDKALEEILSIQEVEVVHSERIANKPISEQPLKFKVQTKNRTMHIIVASRDKMNEKMRAYALSFRAGDSKSHAHQFNFTQAPAISARAPLGNVGSSSAPPSSSSSPESSTQGSKWFNLKNIKSNLNGRKDIESPPPDPTPQPKLVKSNSLTNLSIVGTGNKSVLVQQGSFNNKNKFITRVHWRDNTYRTVQIVPGVTAKEVCELATKKTKIALFENLFYLYEKLPNGDERVLDHKTDVYELIAKWGPNSENQLVCDLNLDVKNTVKSKMQAGGSKYNSYNESYDSKYGSMDLDDIGGYYTEDDKSVEMMIQEMVKLKNQLAEEDEMLRAIEIEELQVDRLIARLAQL